MKSNMDFFDSGGALSLPLASDAYGECEHTFKSTNTLKIQSKVIIITFQSCWCLFYCCRWWIPVGMMWTIGVVLTSVSYVCTTVWAFDLRCESVTYVAIYTKPYATDMSTVLCNFIKQSVYISRYTLYPNHVYCYPLCESEFVNNIELL